MNYNHNTAIVSIADGVGSCALSNYGSSIATKTATEYLAHIFHFDDIRYMTDKQIGDHIRQAMRNANNAITKYAEDNQQLEYSFQTTLTIAIYDGKKLFFGHIGDDGIVALTQDGTLEMVTQRHKGEEASSVFPLQIGEKYWQVGKVNSPVDGIIMATDGVLDYFVKSDVEGGNRIYFPFIEDALKGNPDKKDLQQDDFSEMALKYYDLLNSDEFRNEKTGVSDDITFFSIANSKIRDNPYRFDKDKWERDARRYMQMRQQILYPSNR